jgi:methenyltetrahydrofolate cyclohydrolase
MYERSLEHMHDSSRTIADFVAATAAKSPTPGGGSVAALVGALSAALGEMVVNYSIGKKGLEAFEPELKPALAELHRARQVLLQLMVEDQLAYEALSAARKLPAGSNERKDKLPPALLACIRVPEAIAATGACILELCDRLVSFANPYLLGDLAVSADLSMAAIRCAVYNVRINLKAVDEEEDRRSIEQAVSQILSRAVGLIQNVAPRIWERESQGI